MGLISLFLGSSTLKGKDGTLIVLNTCSSIKVIFLEIVWRYQMEINILLNVDGRLLDLEKFQASK